MTSSRLGTHNKSTNWLGCLETSSAVAGLADDINIARRILAKAVAYSPNDTLLNRMSGPLVAAQLVLNENKPLDDVASNWLASTWACPRSAKMP